MKIDSWTGGLEEAGTVREALALLQAEARQRREYGATLEELAASYNVSKATFSRVARTAV